ncbi:hypothetical protein [Escherichia coli]|nr:hypothetical protein [Escherichia coli]
MFSKLAQSSIKAMFYCFH